MQRSLLDFTQDVLSSLGSDEVNSINDTLESQSVSRIIRRSFYNIVDRRALKNQKDLFSLDASTDGLKPTLMSKPSNVRNIDWIKYDKQTLNDPIMRFDLVTYLEPGEFINSMNNLRSDDTNVDTFSHIIDGSTIAFMVRNDTAPTYYTSFNDGTIVFDGYDNTVDSTLQKNKTQCYGEKMFSFSMTDTFVPPISDEQQNLLLNEAIALAWVELKQSPNPKAEVNARKGWIRQQHTSQTIPSKIDPLSRAPNYGRK